MARAARSIVVAGVICLALSGVSGAAATLWEAPNQPMLKALDQLLDVFDESAAVEAYRAIRAAEELAEMDLNARERRLCALVATQLLSRATPLLERGGPRFTGIDPETLLNGALATLLVRLADAAAVPHLQELYLALGGEGGRSPAGSVARAIIGLGGEVPVMERTPEQEEWPPESVLPLDELRQMRVERILQHLHEEDWDTTKFHAKSGQAIHELGELRAQEAVPYVLEQLDQEKPYIVRERAISALGKIGDPKAIEPLLRFLRNDEVPGNPEDSAVLRGHAIRALAHLQAKAALPDIKACLKDPAAYVRWRAAEAVADLGEEADLEALEELRNDEDESVRQVVKVLLEGRAEPSTEQ